MEVEEINKLLCLPGEILIKILTHLSYGDLCRLGSTCRRLHTLSQHEPLWKNLCQKIWMDDKMKHSNNSWREHFCQWFASWGRYISCYASVKHQWNRIEAGLKKRCPIMLSKLEGPANEQELNDVEALLSCSLPPEVQCFYRIHKGQTMNEINEAVGGLIGSVTISQYRSSEYLIDLTLSMIHVETMILHNVWPLTFCPYSRLTQGLCLQDIPGGRAGQIIYLDSSTIPLDESNPSGYFISANSFMEWLTALADKHSDPNYTVLNGRLYKFYHDPSCVEVTHDVKVTVSTAFIPNFSRIAPKGKLTTYFAYRITLHMDKNVPPSRACKLTHRHWEIIDESGKTEVVDGEGVVGETPVIKPGNFFSWISCTSFSTSSGNMKGWFRVYNLQTGDEYRIICPCFHMECPPVSRIPSDQEEESCSDDDQSVT